MADIRDEAGRIVAPPQSFDDYERPAGPWDDNRPAAAPRRICAWCPDFNASDPRNAHASHGMCPTCAERLRREMHDGL